MHRNPLPPLSNLFLPCLLHAPAVITGVQVHNWAYEFEDDSPNLEFVASTSVYVVVDGVKAHLDIAAIPVSCQPAQQA